MSRPYASVSIICVYNNLAVREHCLDRSIKALSNEAAEVEYLPVENVNNTYSSAGAALNHGVSLAKNEVVAFAHQDVYLHSLTALKEAAGQLQQAGSFGLLGAVGVRTDGQLVGRIRDRVLLAGEIVDRPTEVDSVDEVLFLAPRSQLLSEPLVESHDLAWHAYAVEYGLRMRRKGLRTGVTNIPLTHNSLSINMERLDNAHQAVAKRYSDLLPVTTTCGTITAKTSQENRFVWFPSQRWRYRWLRDSVALQGARKTAGRIVGVLADIRHDVDDLIERAPGRRLHIFNCSTGRPFVPDDQEPLELSRRDGVVVFSDCAISQVPAALADLPPGSWTLLTNLSETDMKVLEPQLSVAPTVLGFHMATGLWLLLGATFTELPDSWRSNRATPLGPRSLVGASFHH